jgi:hypothetical protein
MATPQKFVQLMAYAGCIVALDAEGRVWCGGRHVDVYDISDFCWREIVPPLAEAKESQR